MTIGEKLKQRRNELGLSLEDISDQIKISPKILEKIESGDQNHGVAPAILKGFVRSYIRHLKLDDNLILPMEVKLKEPVKKPAMEGVHDREEGSTFSWLKWIVTGGALIGIAIGIKLIQKYQAETYESNIVTEKQISTENLVAPSETSNQDLLKSSNLVSEPSSPSITQVSNPSDNLNSKSSEAEPLAEVSSLEPQPTPTPPTAQLTTSAPAPDILTREVILEAKRNTSVRIKPQDKIAIEKQLQGGKFYLFKETVPFSIKGEDSGAIQIIVNGRILHTPKNSGQPVNLEIKE
jgi:cytoskeleton protein RodZ